MKKIILDGVEVLVEEKDNYLQMNDICASDLSRIWDHIKTNYHKYEKWLCYHSTEVPITVLNGLEAVLKDNSIELRIDFNSFSCSETPGIIQITDNSFSEFAAYHDKNYPDMYWTSERIRRDLSRWAIHAMKHNNQIDGYVLISMWDPINAEIYCLDASASAQCELLIKSAVRHAFDNGKKEVIYMADENTISYEAALSIGFAITGFYKGYVVL